MTTLETELEKVLWDADAVRTGVERAGRMRGE